MPAPLPPLTLPPERLSTVVRHRIRDALRVVLGVVLESLVGPAGLDSRRLSVIEGDALRTDMLESLFTNRSAAIHIRKFCSLDVCQKINEFVLARFKFTNWGESFNAVAEPGASYDTDMFYGVGLASAVIYQSEAARARYFQEAVPAMRSVRTALEAVGLGPTDKLRLELDELWRYGAQVKVHRVYRRKMLAGIGRLMRPTGMLKGLEAEGIVHTDSDQLLSSRRGAFTANIYMTMPQRGGELVIWDIHPSLWQFLRNASYFRLFDDVFDRDRARDIQDQIRARLPEPVVVTPGQGDLVIFNSGRPHAVRGFDDPCRLTFQTFIEYAADQPLQLFA